MSDEKCKHPRTKIELTKSSIKKVCQICGAVVKSYDEEVTIEKVVPPQIDVEKTLN